MEWVRLTAETLTVIAVAIYAWLTFRIVQEMRLSRSRQAIPFVSVTPVGGTISEFRFRIANDGNSVALGLYVDLVNPELPMWRNQAGQMLHLPGGVVVVEQRGALAPGDALEVTANLGFVDRTPWIMRAIYTNVLEQKFEVRQPFAREGDRILGRPLDTEFFIDARRIIGKPESLEPFRPPRIEAQH